MIVSHMICKYQYIYKQDGLEYDSLPILSNTMYNMHDNIGYSHHFKKF